MKIICKFADIPKESKVVLYGAGTGGGHIFALLSHFRKDIKIIGFVDSKKSGTFKGIPIYKVEDFLIKDTGEVNWLITSMFWSEIRDDLLNKGVEKIWFVPPRFLFASAMEKLMNNSAVDPKDNTLAPDLFSDDDRIKFRSQLKEVVSLLDDPNDRHLFQMLVGENRLQKVGEYFFNNQSNNQYFDFIPYAEVQTLIDGGVADGREILMFLKEMKNCLKIYGFEPEIQSFIGSPYMKQIESNSKIEIIPLGLWSGSKELLFEKNGRGSNVLTGKNQGVRIRTVSIDEFVKEKKIEKIDMIKLDVEGAELEVLKGAVDCLYNHRPYLAVCLYHKKEDFFKIPLFLDSILEDYQYRIGHYTAGNLETVWYGIPKKFILN